MERLSLSYQGNFVNDKCKNNVNVKPSLSNIENIVDFFSLFYTYFPYN